MNGETMKKYKNMRTPFWNFVEGFVMLINSLAIILSLGFYHPDWWVSFIEWKLLEMFKEE